MAPHRDDIRIRSLTALEKPSRIIDAYPCTSDIRKLVAGTRTRIHAIMHGTDQRVAVMVGPCSIHDREAALEYAQRLAPLRAELSDTLEIVMRMYFEKPRTTVGWKGLINDPDLNETFNINAGIRLARSLLLDVNALGVPAGCEYLDTTTPQYLSDLVSWGAIGARTTESQVHREMASGLSCPVGFKNGTSGNVQIAVDAVAAAARPHHFLAMTRDGRSGIAATTGNADGHVILRGGKEPNYDAESIAAACTMLRSASLPARIVVDASHANSLRNPDNQPGVVASIAAQIESGSEQIAGVMIESNLIGGRQNPGPDRPLTYGQSITDGCIDWDATVRCLHQLADSVYGRLRSTAAA